jgi:predicted RNA-binding Zn ribbon-like protein
LCLDFCNSGQNAREPSGTEWITGFADFIDWLEAAEAITRDQATRLRRAAAASPRAAAQVWGRAIKFREALFRVLNAKAEGGAIAREDLSTIEAEHARAASFARLSRDGDGYRWALDPSAAALDAAMQPLVESAVSLLTSAKMERLRRCGNSTCYWLFLDETKNHSRRWCEMASCGNVVKVRRHREKARSAAH